MPFTLTGTYIKTCPLGQLFGHICILKTIIYRFVFSNLSRDYETLNHQMLQSLIEKINGMQGKKQLIYEDDSDVNWSLWVDSDITKDELNDLNYMLPEEVKDDSGTTTSVSREYNLRNRHH